MNRGKRITPLAPNMPQSRLHSTPTQLLFSRGSIRFIAAKLLTVCVLLFDNVRYVPFLELSATVLAQYLSNFTITELNCM